MVPLWSKWSCPSTSSGFSFLLPSSTPNLKLI
jgi:hypothetical protein